MNKENLTGKSIVISGVFEKYSREQLKTIIEQGGGKASSSISKNTSFILAGDKMGPSKKEKAIELNIELISEKEFIKRYIDSNNGEDLIIDIPELELKGITLSDLDGLYDQDEIKEIKDEIISEGSYDDDCLQFYKDDDSEKFIGSLSTGSFEIIDHINSIKILENDPFIMIVKDAWDGENEEGEEVGYISFEALYDVEDPPTLKGGEYDKKSFMSESELDEFYELSENENIMMDVKYQEFYFLKKSNYNAKEWIEKWLSEDYGHNK